MARNLRSVATLNKKECKDMYESKDMNEDIYVNPITQTKIDAKEKQFKHLDEHCKKIEDDLNRSYQQDLVEQWIANPLTDPVTKKKIELGIALDSQYGSLYKMAYTFYNGKGYNDEDIQEKLPKKHILFNGKLDLIFYTIVRDRWQDANDEIMHYEYVLEKLHMINVSKNKARGKKAVVAYENAIVDIILNDFVDCIISCMSYVYYLQIMQFQTMSDMIQSITFTYSTVQQLNMLVNYFDIYNLFYFSLKYWYENSLENYVYGVLNENMHINDNYIRVLDIFLSRFVENNDVFDTLDRSLEEILDIYNYERNPDASPFENINAKRFTEIDDPLIGILDKIGVTNIDVATLELPKRIFDNDREYGTYITQFNTLKRKYKRDMSVWRSSKKENQPKHPTLTLPNKTVVNVVTQQFPRYVKDKKYNEIVKSLNDNKHIIDLYKELIDVGILDLMQGKKTKSVIMNRNYFKDNILHDAGIDDKSRCISNTDGISYDDFDDDNNYMLAKLQLMFRLHTINNKGDIVRTDCFYAPNFYNHIVRRINMRLPINNPVTNAVIDDNQIDGVIDELMKIMRIVKPDIERPEFILPPYDNDYIINHSTVSYKGHQYYEIYTERIIMGVKMPIYFICTIPADIDDPVETGSTDMTSSTFLAKIYDLFNNGLLMHTYVPPYSVEGEYVKLMIHFNRYKNIEDWDKPRKEKIRMLKHYMEEILRF